VILEYRPDQEGDVRLLVREPLKLVDGHIQIPEGPGLGIELNEEVYARFPGRTWRRQLVTEPDGNILYD
jgi:L-alanine-DL-glutamate epimerase-like enolase superfamily enzyme